MATVGQTLTAPETGWQRIDDNNSHINYIGDNWQIYNGISSEYYGNTYHQLNGTSAGINFKFKGTKFRIIGKYFTNKTTAADVYVDSVKVGTINEYNATEKFQVLVFESTGLADAEHIVSIINTTSNYLFLDAIDIDSTGYMVDLENALLRVTMNDSSEREYKLPKTDIDGFVNWFTRTVGTGTSVYVLNKMTGSKEYLAFDKIISFEVIPVA